jgi:Tol biopolymer transport system component
MVETRHPGHALSDTSVGAKARGHVVRATLALAATVVLAASACSSTSTDHATDTAGATGSTAPAACGLDAPVHQQTIPLPEQPLNSGWSPDSTQIAWADRETGTISIYDVAAGTSRAITGPIHAVAPRWANTGQIYYAVRPDGGGEGVAENASHHDPPELWVMDADGSNPRQIHLTGSYPSGPTTVWWDSSAPAKFSPDGKHVAFSTVQDGHWIMLLGAITTTPDGQLEVAELTPLNSPDGFWWEAKAFTPDGQTLIFASSRGDGSGGPTFNPDTYTMRLADRSITRYTHDPSWDETMDISTTGAVVISSDRAQMLPFETGATAATGSGLAELGQLNGQTPHHDLYLTGPQGDAEPMRRLTNDGADFDSIRPRFSPDGRHITVSQRQGKGDAATERVVLLTFDCPPQPS